MTPINALRFLRSIDFPADPIAAPDFAARDADYNTDPIFNIPDAISALFPHRTLDDLTDSDYDALDDALYPSPD